jgi:hypothetical protein
MPPYKLTKISQQYCITKFKHNQDKSSKPIINKILTEIIFDLTRISCTMLYRNFILYAKKWKEISSMAHIIGTILFSAIGLLVVISIIKIPVLLTRTNFIRGKNKIIIWIIAILQAGHILFYITDSLAKMCEVNVYAAFAVCVFLSLTCLSLSLWLVLPFAKFRNTTKYLFTFFAVVQVWTTTVIFLMTDGTGFPPLIQF